MDSVEILIPDNVGNYLVVVLTFYDDINKSKVLNIPPDLADFELVDISIRKLDLDKLP